jgi:hypothetical protein
MLQYIYSVIIAILQEKGKLPMSNYKTGLCEEARPSVFHEKKERKRETEHVYTSVGMGDLRLEKCSCLEGR